MTQAPSICGLAGCFPEEGRRFTDDMLYSWIEQQVHQNRTVPLYNLVVLIACNGVGNGTSGRTGDAFGVSDGNNGRPPAVNQCVIAFWPYVGSKTNKENLPKWVEAFFAYLNKGCTVNESIKRVRADGITLQNPEGQIISPMKIGDSTTKIKGYYGSAEGVTTWVRVS